MKNFDKLGWVAAIGLVGAMVGMGFQAPGTKIGSVDLPKVFNESEFAKKQNESLRGIQAARQAVLGYLETYRSAKPEDAQKFRELSLKDNQTAADKAALEQLKVTIQADDRKFKELQTKSSPTPEETAQLQEYNRRAQQVTALQQRWNQEFEREIGEKYTAMRNDALERVKIAIGEVAKQQGYTVVFSSEVAPYAANDVTAEALKAMNAKK